MNEQRPSVSVLMTIYNAAPYLKEAIDSIVAQSFGDWELIAVENGSRDDSFAILSGYQDERIRVFRLPENIGRTPALRYAFEQVRGQYIAVLDADDVSHPERLKKQVEYLDLNPDVGLLGSWAAQINGNSEIVNLFTPPVSKCELSDALGWSNPFVHSSIMYRASLAKRIGGYSAGYMYAQDYALILGIEKEAELAMLGEALCKWRVLETSMTSAPEYGLTIAKELFSLGKIAAQRNFFSARSRKRSLHRQAVNQLKLGVFLLRNNKLLEGLPMAIKAIIAVPSCLLFNGYAEELLGRVSVRTGNLK